MTDNLRMIRPRLVDFHCHLDLYPDHTAVLSQCDRERVATLAVTTTPKAWRRNRLLAERTEMVRVALGLHPQLAQEREDELPLFEKLLGEARYVGEVGLDAGPRFFRSMPVQERIFSRVLAACREQGGKVLSVHSVRTVTKVLDHLETSLPPDRGRCVLHWFTGTGAEADRAVQYGCYFSINSQMLEKSSHRVLVAKLPMDRLLTETDGPFVDYQGRPMKPSDVRLTVDKLAELRSVSVSELQDTILKNLQNLLGPMSPAI